MKRKNDTKNIEQTVNIVINFLSFFCRFSSHKFHFNDHRQSFIAQLLLNSLNEMIF